MTFRGRLLLAALATLAVGLGAVLVVGNVFLSHRVDAEASSLLRARAEAQLAGVSVTDAGIVPHETPADTVLDRRSWVLDGDRVIERPAAAPADLDRAAVALGRGRRAAEQDGPGDTRLYARPVLAPGRATPVGTIVVAMSVHPLERLRDEVVFGSAVVALLVLLAGAIAIRHAVDGALRPVAQMTESAEDWGAHDLDRRFDLGPPRDELSGLAATLDHLLGRIAASRRHEQRFAGDVAHELRTPLARMRGRAELALGNRGPGGEAERADALQGVLEETDRLDATIGALLALARQEIAPAASSVDLAAIARELEDVAVVVPGPVPRAEGEADVVRRALAPLVENARRHARAGVTVEVTADAGHVRAAVRDDGPGVDPGLGDRVFEPGVRGEGGGGVGLGLPLARRLARSCGGDVRLGAGPGGCFVLELPVVGGPEDT